MSTDPNKQVYYTGKYTRPLSVLILGQKIPFDPATQKSLLLSPESAVWLVANDPDCWTLDQPGEVEPGYQTNPHPAISQEASTPIESEPRRNRKE